MLSSAQLNASCCCTRVPGWAKYHTALIPASSKAMAETAPSLAQQSSASQPATASPASSAPTSKQVSMKALSYLLNETVAHAVRSTIKSRSEDGLSGGRVFADVLGRVDFLEDATDVVAPSTLSYMNRIGYNVGFKTANILLMENTDATSLGNVSTTALVDNPLEAMKFICRDVWKNLFGKQMDNLRTNHIGTFVLIDNKPVPYASCHFYEGSAAVIDNSGSTSTLSTPRNMTISSFNSLPGVSETDQEQGQDTITDPTLLRASAYLEFNCGVIQGVLQCLGVGSGIASVSVQPEEEGRNGDARSVVYTVETRSA